MRYPLRARMFLVENEVGIKFQKAKNLSYHSYVSVKNCPESNCCHRTGPCGLDPRTLPEVEGWGQEFRVGTPRLFLYHVPLQKDHVGGFWVWVWLANCAFLSCCPLLLSRDFFFLVLPEVPTIPQHCPHSKSGLSLLQLITIKVEVCKAY